MVTKNLVAGLGEIGIPILQILSKKVPVDGYDINQNLMKKIINKSKISEISFLHICIPFSKKFESNTLSLYKKFQPQVIVIHSTIRPNTTKKLQEKLDIPIIYSATRGVHRRMINDTSNCRKRFCLFIVFNYCIYLWFFMIQHPAFTIAKFFVKVGLN